MNYIEEYYSQIKSGKIVAGKWIKRVYAYLVKGLQKELFFFDQKNATSPLTLSNASATTARVAPTG